MPQNSRSLYQVPLTISPPPRRRRATRRRRPLPGEWDGGRARRRVRRSVSALQSCAAAECSCVLRRRGCSARLLSSRRSVDWTVLRWRFVAGHGGYFLAPGCPPGRCASGLTPSYHSRTRAPRCTAPLCLPRDGERRKRARWRHFYPTHPQPRQRQGGRPGGWRTSRQVTKLQSQEHLNPNNPTQNPNVQGARAPRRTII